MQFCDLAYRKSKYGPKNFAWFLLALLVYNKSPSGRERRSDAERGARSPAIKTLNHMKQKLA